MTKLRYCVGFRIVILLLVFNLNKAMQEEKFSLAGAEASGSSMRGRVMLALKKANRYDLISQYRKEACIGDYETLRGVSQRYLNIANSEPHE